MYEYKVGHSDRESFSDFPTIEMVDSKNGSFSWSAKWTGFQKNVCISIPAMYRCLIERGMNIDIAKPTRRNT